MKEKRKEVEKERNVVGREKEKRTSAGKPIEEQAYTVKQILVSVRLAEQPPEAAIVGRVSENKSVIDTINEVVLKNTKEGEAEEREASSAIKDAVNDKPEQLVVEIDGKTATTKDKIGGFANETEIGEGVKALTANIVLAIAQQGGNKTR